MEMMDEARIEHIPVLDGLQYLGMVAFDELEDAEPAAEVISLQHRFIKPLVRTGDHFLQALRVRAKFYIDQVPVVNEHNEWEGVIGMAKMLDQISLLSGVSESGSMIVLEVARHDYAPGEINRLVESNDAMIMQLNSIQDQHTGMMQVVLRINKEEVSDVVATFQRHEYNVLYYYGDESYDNSLQNNLDHLMNYLNL
jgi:signal-transduction protein with cAMP-binding, CBS, and nucleotidyltransferase domain